MPDYTTFIMILVKLRSHLCHFKAGGREVEGSKNSTFFVFVYSRVAYIYVRSRAKYLKFRTSTSKFNTLRKPLMQQKY